MAAEGRLHAGPVVGEVELGSLIAEVYGAEADRFLATARKSLGGRTPAEALRDGDVQTVWEVVTNDLLGHWA